MTSSPIRMENAPRANRGGNLLLLALLGVIGAAVVGGVLYWTTTFTMLYFVSVLLASFVLFGFVWVGVRYGKVRNATAALVLGAFSGLLMYAVYRGVEYVDFRRVQEQYALEDLRPSQKRPTSQEIQAELDEILEEETGQRGPLGYFMLMAQEGMSVESTRSYSTSSSGFDISGPVVWGYWALEVLIAMAVPAAMARGTARQAFCNNTNDWLKYNSIGWVRRDHFEAYMNALRNGDVQSAAEVMVPKPGWGVHIRIDLGRCGSDEDGLMRAFMQAGRSSRYVVENVRVPARLYDMLERA